MGESDTQQNIPITIARLMPRHAAVYRELMLEAYESAPEAFTSTPSERASLPLGWWADRVSDRPDASQLVVGAFERQRLVGVAGLRFHRRKRTRHRATLFGMFVRPELARRGIGRALVEAALGEATAAPETVVVELTVTESNLPAIRLYESCGFVPWGTHPVALCIGRRELAKIHLWRRVDSRPGRDVEACEPHGGATDP
ncbi:MAG: GNAT family N-acetyltransferase [Acidobacteriota bacterium]